MQVCAIKAPGFGENRKSSLHDLAILTGGDVSLSFEHLNFASGSFYWFSVRGCLFGVFVRIAASACIAMSEFFLTILPDFAEHFMAGNRGRSNFVRILHLQQSAHSKWSTSTSGSLLIELQY